MRGTLSCLCSALPERCPSIFNDVVCAGFGCYSNESIRAELVPGILAEYPAPTSFQNIEHWNQFAGHVAHYHYMSDVENIRKYNSTTAPIYNVDHLEVPTAFFYGGRYYQPSTLCN